MIYLINVKCKEKIYEYEKGKRKGNDLWFLFMINDQGAKVHPMGMYTRNDPCYGKRMILPNGFYDQKMIMIR